MKFPFLAYFRCVLRMFMGPTLLWWDYSEGRSKHGSGCLNFKMVVETSREFSYIVIHVILFCISQKSNNVPDILNPLTIVPPQQCKWHTTSSNLFSSRLFMTYDWSIGRNSIRSNVTCHTLPLSSSLDSMSLAASSQVQSVLWTSHFFFSPAHHPFSPISPCFILP